MSRELLSTAPYRPPYLRIALQTGLPPVLVFAVVILRSREGPAAYLQAFRAPHAPRLELIAAAPLAAQLHLAAIGVATLVGLLLISGVKGSRTHRVLGWCWASALCLAAASSLFVRTATGVSLGGFGPLHLFSVLALATVPLAVWAARRGRVPLHARIMVGWFCGVFLAAGLFAFLPGRLMWQVFFG